jgi:acetyl-CoA carboxylase biotin carboxyl carrier protein
VKIVADVAGKVWKIEARPGAQLAADQIILILESMKMEIPVAAPRAARLVALHVKEGEMVEEGRVVATIE